MDRMIYLTEKRIAYTEETTSLLDVMYPQNVHLFPDTYAKTNTGMVYPPHKLADKVIDPEIMERSRDNPIRTAFILAAGNAHFAGLNPKDKEPNCLSYDYKPLPMTLTQVYAGRIAAAFGATDLVVTDASACASSLKVMMDVQTYIRNYAFDRVIVLGVEDAVSNTVLNFFGQSGASLTLEKEKQGEIRSAFDPVNGGFYVGQGAVFAMFETERSIRYSGNTPCAELISAYSASEHSTNAIGQREDGQGFKRAIQGVVYGGNVDLNKIRLVKTHGTGTKSNDLAERTALTATLKEFQATSFKQRIGHTMGASGLLETILLLDNVKNGLVPAIPNRTDEDSIFLSKPVPAERGGLILSLAAGMGNIYSAAIFKDLQC